ncbi:MAG: SGNH/GDSL hydrolase family protein [Spirochaetes bacterium]|nr:SGNH/GDSL hydrolase family protein [Spirochaetota bacterium]
MSTLHGIALAAVAGILLACGAIYLYGYLRATKLPANRPAVFLKSPPAPRGTVVVCAGDSNTHGRVCVNYVDLLAARLSAKGFSFVNAGINSELAWNLVQRVDDIIRCNPDFVTVLIGSNDANGTLSEKVARRQAKEMGLPRRADADWFRENLRALCSALKEKTRARVALLSLPPIGEEPGSAAFRRAAEFSAIVKEVAHAEGVAYLPLNEKLSEHISRSGLRPKVLYDNGAEAPMYFALVKRFLLGKSFDDISRDNGFSVLTDLLHLNSTGAETAADLVADFVLGSGKQMQRRR